MRRLASLVRRFFGPRVRRPIDDDPSLPFTPEEFGRLIRSGRHEDMKLLAEGHSVKEIAYRLKLSVKTVEVHKYNLMKKIDVHDRAELIKYAIQKKLIAV